MLAPGRPLRRAGEVASSTVSSMSTSVEPRTRQVVTSARGRDEVTAGVRAMAPMLLAYAPFGLLVGAAVAASDNPTAAWLSTWTIYGGAAHLAVLEVLSKGTGALAAALVGLLVNARIVAYSVSIAPDWRDASTASKVAAAATLTDASWSLAHGYPATTPRARRRFYFGAAFTLWVGWPVLVTLGVLVGGWVGGVPVATLLPSLTLGAVVVRQLRNRPALAAAVVASGTAVLTARLPGGTALALSALGGVLAAWIAHRRSA